MLTSCVKCRMILANARLIFPDGIRDGLEVVVANGKICRGSRTIRRRRNRSGRELSRAGIRRSSSARRDGSRRDGSVGGGVPRDLRLSRERGHDLALVDDSNCADGAEIARRSGSRAGRRRRCRRSRAFTWKDRLFLRARGAQRKEFICDPDPIGRSIAAEFSDVIKRVTLAPELPGALEAIDRLRAQDIA